jgi:DeoR family transcriptional regulator, glycerol-3-phosphate regulon repressor
MKSQKINTRLNLILGLVTQAGSMVVADIAKTLGVSEETIRRDARMLEQRGEVLKLHGALAIPHQVGETPFDRRLRENADAKRAIARKAVELVQDGDSLIIDTGTTTSIFAQELRKRRALTVVTNSSDIARTLATVNGNKVFMAGGELKADNGAAFGPSAVDFIARFRVRHSFISIAAINATDGLMDVELEEAEFAQMALTRAENGVMLTDASKFGQSALVKVCGFTEINRLVTDQAPDPELAKALADAGVNVDIATSTP